MLQYVHFVDFVTGQSKYVVNDICSATEDSIYLKYVPDLRYVIIKMKIDFDKFKLHDTNHCSCTFSIMNSNRDMITYPLVVTDYDYFMERGIAVETLACDRDCCMELGRFDEAQTNTRTIDISLEHQTEKPRKDYFEFKGKQNY